MPKKRRIDREHAELAAEEFTKRCRPRKGLLAHVIAGMLVGFAEYDDAGPALAGALNGLAAAAEIEDRWIPVVSRSEARQLWPDPGA